KLNALPARQKPENSRIGPFSRSAGHQQDRIALPENGVPLSCWTSPQPRERVTKTRRMNAQRCPACRGAVGEVCSVQEMPLPARPTWRTSSGPTVYQAPRWPTDRIELERLAGSARLVLIRGETVRFVLRPVALTRDNRQCRPGLGEPAK